MTIFKPFHNYMVSEHGEITSKHGALKPFEDKDGYLRIHLYIQPGRCKKIHIHRIVYMAFYGEIPKDMVCCHIDSNKRNNHYTNLRIATQKENIGDKLKNGTWQAGDTHPRMRYPDHIVEMVQQTIKQNPDFGLLNLTKLLAPLPKHFVFDVKRGKRKTREQRIKERLSK